MIRVALILTPDSTCISVVDIVATLNILVWQHICMPGMYGGSMLLFHLAAFSAATRLGTWTDSWLTTYWKLYPVPVG
jgi:hypothetical protein